VRSRATFVRAPVATSFTLCPSGNPLAALDMCSYITFTHFPGTSMASGSRGSGNRGSPSRLSSPVSPWISAQWVGGRTRGLACPLTTGRLSESMPKARRQASAFTVVLATDWLPCTVEIPRRLTHGLYPASKIAIASSCPGSQSSQMAC